MVIFHSYVNVYHRVDQTLEQNFECVIKNTSSWMEINGLMPAIEVNFLVSNDLTNNHAGWGPPVISWFINHYNPH